MSFGRGMEGYSWHSVEALGTRLEGCICKAEGGGEDLQVVNLFPFLLSDVFPLNAY